MDTRRLKYFLVVVEEGSISRAARRLHLTQPPLSQAIKALELEVGAVLLQRLPRGVEPTAAGRALAEQGQDLLRWADRVEDHVRRMGEGSRGRLQIACVPSFAWTGLPPVLKRFAREAPDIQVELSDPRPEHVLNLVAEGGADVGIVAPADLRAVASSHPGLTVDFLTEVPLGIAVPADLELHDGPVDVIELADRNWIIPGVVQGFPGLIDLAEELWRRSGIRPRQVQFVSTLQTALPLIAAGIGVGLMPLASGVPLTSGVRISGIRGGVGPLQAGVIHSAGVRPSPAPERFLALLHEMYPADAVDLPEI